ncbi:hypothetical protein FACS1894102_4000 [Spirochaetia bacterium]|nr:hypothetical protein FACS1894102_4000 [Spirochaetia bacterium]
MTTASQEPQMGLTFEQVWAALMETRQVVMDTQQSIVKMTEERKISQDKVDEEIKESRKETERIMKETSERIEKMQKETSERIEKTQKETDKRIEKTQKETSEQIAKTQKETDKQLKETSERIEKTQKETSEQIKKTQKETDKQVKRMSRNLGGIGDSLGQLVETLIAAKLWEKFDAYPYNLKRAYQRVPLFDENNTVLTDIDILLSNGEYVMAVEVKQRFHRLDDVERHIKRVELMKKYPPAECKGKKMLGAIAGGTVESDAKKCAHDAGLFVLELKGESVHLVEAPKDFTPRQW